MQKPDVVSQDVHSQRVFDSTWLAPVLIKKTRTPTGQFEQRAVIKLCANSGMTPKISSDNNSGNACSIAIVFDFEKIERTSATISGVGDPVFPTALRTFILLSFGVHGSRVEKS